MGLWAHTEKGVCPLAGKWWDQDLNWVEPDPKAHPLSISIPTDMPLIGLPFAESSPMSDGPSTPTPHPFCMETCDCTSGIFLTLLATNGEQLVFVECLLDVGCAVC